ncbi:hypothetical protein [Coleofasciculus sp. E1-EBD-02]|uniref:hypothetical protein n=1 Tax=Coleofasciculus sp. E1-EBD-02 TaxID=3068481 RepID=UPI0032F13585
MTILFRRIKPRTFPITLDMIAQFLGIPKSMIIRAEHWAYVLFVHRRDRGGQFIIKDVVGKVWNTTPLLLPSCSPLPIPPFQRGVRGDGEGLGVRAVA